jgi:outer membrane usher protein
VRCERWNEHVARLARAAAFGVLACLTAANARAQDQRVVLPVSINHVARGDFTALLRGTDILLGVAALEAAGVRGFAGNRVTIDGEEFVSLSSLGPDVSFALDPANLTLSVTVPPRWLGVTVLNMGVGRPPGISYSSETSAFVNYTANWRDFESFDGFAEGGLSVGGKLLYSSVSRDATGNLVRGQTNLTVDRRDNLQRIVLGDAFANAGELGGGAFLAGVSVARDYGLDPYFIPYPTMTLGGAVTTPSRADIYVDGALVRREELPPGQFDLTNLQLPTGSGNVQVVIRDAFGQERVFANPFYATTQLLAQGYQDYSYSLGFRRDNVGTASADYGSLVFLGRHRFGWTDSVTPEARIEAGRQLASGGVGVAWRVASGEFSLDLAGSRDHGKAGGAGSFSYRFIGRPVSFGLLLRRQSERYATVSFSASDDRPTLDVNAFAGVQLSGRLSITGQYTLSQMRDAPETRRASVIASLTTQRLGSVFLSIGRSSLAGTAGTDAFLGYSYAFAGNTVASVSYARQQGAGTTNVNVQRPLPVGEGIGYQASASTASGSSQGSGLFQYQGPFGRYDFEVVHSGGIDTKTVSVTGGVVMIGGALLPTRTVGDSFALVRVPGVDGVTALANNQPVGRTDASGDVLVPNLLPYYGNRLGIKDTDIPLDYEVGATERTVAPPFRGGALVTFPVRRIQSIRGSVTVEAALGERVPAFGQMTLRVTGHNVVSPLGGAGEFEFENVVPGNYKALVEFKDGTCSFIVHVPESNEQFIDLGVLRCSAPDLQ